VLHVSFADENRSDLELLSFKHFSSFEVVTLTFLYRLDILFICLAVFCNCGSNKSRLFMTPDKGVIVSQSAVAATMRESPLVIN